MEIRVEREISFRLAVHGRLLIDGDRVCDTLENGATCMKPAVFPSSVPTPSSPPPTASIAWARR